MTKAIRTLALSCAAITLLAIAAGCGKGHASKGTFSTILAKKIEAWSGPYIENEYFRFPMFSAQDSDEAREIFTPLIEAGVVTRTEKPYEMKSYRIGGEVAERRMVPGYQYDLTPAANKAYFKWDKRDGGGFYAGRYELVDVFRFTEPADMFGHRVSQVTYTYRVKPSSIPNWATHAAMRNRYENLRNLAQPIQKTDTFILSSEGWIHEDDMK